VVADDSFSACSSARLAAQPTSPETGRRASTTRPYCLGIPIINSERSDNYRLSHVQRLDYALTRSWETALVANSHAGLAFARRLHRLPADCGHVVWNGIDLAAARLEAVAAPALRGALWPGQEFFIACLVGTITPPKDHLLALDTAAVLHKRDPR
jgi:hypothetical protein